MKRLICLVLSLSFFVSTASAELVNCDWKQIKHNPDGTLLYSPLLHECVGRLVINQKLDNEQINLLAGAVTLKDLALKKAGEDSDLWKKTSTDLMIKVDQIQAHEKRSNWIYFGLGFLSAGAVIYGASRIAR